MYKVSIIDACFHLKKQKSQGLACVLLKQRCKTIGIKVVDIEKSDIILLSCVSAQQYKVAKKIKNLFKNKILIIGGPAATSPAIFINHCDAIVCGDGDLFLKKIKNKKLNEAFLLDNVLIKGKKNVKIDQSFPWKTPPIQGEDGAFRIWCGRGCKNKCFFCHTGWSYKYHENPNPILLKKQINNLIKNNKKIACLSNDPMQHSFYDILPIMGHGSFSLRFFKKNGVPCARQVRLGVEGVSEKLRKFVNKPISFDDLVKSSIWLNDNKKSVRWFMIAGLPGENFNDWEELKKTLLEWKRFSKKGVLALSFTAWCPDPSTPLAPFQLIDDYYEYWLDFKRWFFDGLGFSNRIKLMQPQEPRSRLKKAMASMSLNEKELRKGGSWGPNDIVEYPYKNQAKKIYKKQWSIVNH